MGSPSLSRAHLYRWSDLPLENVTPQLDRKFIYGERIMIARVELRQGCVVPMHSHEHEQVSSVVEGALRFWIGEDEAETLVVHAGEVLHLPSRVPHKAEALAPTVVLDTFSPPREDWIAKTDSYLRSAQTSQGRG